MSEWIIWNHFHIHVLNNRREITLKAHMVVCGTWLAFFSLMAPMESLRGVWGLLLVPPFVPIILEENHMGPLDFS